MPGTVPLMDAPALHTHGTVSSLPDLLTTALSDRYRLGGSWGGGMATVYWPRT